MSDLRVFQIVQVQIKHLLIAKFKKSLFKVHFNSSYKYRHPHLHTMHTDSNGVCPILNTIQKYAHEK